MKKERQRRKLKQWLAAALGLTLLGTGLWVGMNKEELQAKPKSNIAFSTKDVKDGEQWLPSYKPGLGIGGGGWLDSTESYIPRNSTFVMQHMTGKTKVVAWSENIAPKETKAEDLPKGVQNNFSNVEIDGTVALSTNPEEPCWVMLGNVGFHNGEYVDVKVTFQNSQKPIEELDRMCYLVVGPKADFLSIGGPAAVRNMKMTYEFYQKDENGHRNKINLGTNMTVRNIDASGKYLFYTQNVANIYSTSRNYQYPTLIELEDSESDRLVVKGLVRRETLGTPPLLDACQLTASLTYDNVTDISFERIPNKAFLNSDRAGLWLSYTNQPYVKVEIPDPQAAIDLTYTEIIGAGRGITVYKKIDPIKYWFIQQMPWESPSPINNRTQIPRWTVDAPADNVTVVPSNEWEVQVLDNPTLGDVSAWFTSTAESNSRTTLTPSGGLTGKLVKDAFYQHYYKFNRSLNIDYNNPIARTALNAKDGLKGYYFDYSGIVDLKVEDTNATSKQKEGMNKDREKVNYESSINFLAPLEYKYVDSVTGEEIPTSSLPASAKATGDGIVTWQAPWTPQQLTDESYTQKTGQGDAPVIAGYQFDHGELNGSEADTQIKVTKLLRNKTAAEEAAGQNVDANDSSNYTKNNVVTLYYTPLNYQVEMTVKDSKDGEVLSPTEANPSAETHFQAAVVASKGADGWQDKPAEAIDWKPLSEIDFTALDKKYQIKQVSLVKEGYDWDKVTNGSPSNPSPKFWVELATKNETTEYQVKLETGYTLDPTDPYTNHGYLFPATLTVSGEGAAQTRALPLTVINKPIGELKLPTLDPIHFGTDQIKDKDGKTIEGVSLPRSTEKTMIQRSSTSTNWKIKVEDDRLVPYQTGGWKLEATMKQDFTWTNPTDPTRKSVISNLLVFCPEDKDFAEVSANPMGEGSTVVIKEFDTGTQEMKWDPDKGFLLKVDQAKQNEIMAKGTDGNKYVAELEFVLTADPLSEPGK